MNFRSILIAAVALASIGRIQAADFSYANPDYNISVRDCQIVREGGMYYLTGTFPPFGRGISSGVRISHSTDLVHWSEPEVIVPPDPKSWYQILFWAPEIFPYHGRFYATFNCPADGSALLHSPHAMSWPQAVALAVADSIRGPYRVLTQSSPLTDGNDATLFSDSDGRVYVYRATAQGIACAKVNLEEGRTIGDSILCLRTGTADDWDGGAGVGIEGPSVFKRNGFYYLLYSSWRRGYEVGYATAPSPAGPWTKYPGNPIYGAQDADRCRRFHGTYTQSPDIPFGQVGHGSPFFGPDGRIWFCCHGIEQAGRGKDTQPHLVITPMNFGPDGSIRMTLTWTAQSVPVPAAVQDPLWAAAGLPAASVLVPRPGESRRSGSD
jgi:beta-xylosidase